MSSLEIQSSTCSPYFKSPNSCLQSKWFVVALAVSSFVFLGTAAFGATGLLASQLPQWLAHAVGTIGHSGCLAMLMWGTVLGGACAITAIIWSVRKNQETDSTTNYDSIEQTAAIPSEESIEILNAQLIAAARSGRTEEVTSLLNRGANIEGRNRNDMTPLMYASNNGHADVVRILLDQGANIEARNNRDMTPLVFALSGGHDDVVTVLLDRRANIETRDEWGWTPLMYAAVTDNVDAVTILLDHGATIEVRDNEGWTPLMYAAHQGRVGAVTVLLDKRANIEAIDNEGWTPLICAVFKGHVSVVTALLDKRANIEARDDLGETPLISAAARGHIDAVSILLEAGANINARENQGRTAMDRARTDEIRQILLNWMAAHARSPEEVSNNEASNPVIVNLPNEESLERLNIQLIDAARIGQIDEVTSLLNRGANIEARNRNGMTPLLVAAGNGRVNIVHILLDQSRRANIEARDNEGWTPLIFAACNGHAYVVDILLNRGADIEATDNNGRTAIDFARTDTIRQALQRATQRRRTSRI